MIAPVPLLPKNAEYLRPFVDAGVLLHAEVQVAGSVARAVPSTSDYVLLAIALAVRATRLSHVCVVLTDIPGSLVVEDERRWEAAGITEEAAESGPATIDQLPWPTLDDWKAELHASEAVATVDAIDGLVGSGVIDGTIRPLLFDGERIYLERYWRFERSVGDDLLDRSDNSSAQLATQLTNQGLAAATTILDKLFGPASEETSDLQRKAAELTLSHRLVVIAGGPGTGKTRTVARLLALAHAVVQAESRVLQVALAAPTGKAAARMTEAIHQEVGAAGMDDELAKPLLAAEASTIHKLLGGRPGHPNHNRTNPIPADVVVVDEASMISLPLMARLLEAVRSDAQLILVGDPYQLASIESGAVLGDVVGGATEGVHGPLAENVVVLQRVHRFGSDSAIAALAAAMRDGDADLAIEVLGSGHPDVEWIKPDNTRALLSLEDEIVERSLAVVRAALEGDAPAGLAASVELKVLAATHVGPLGVRHWSERIEELVSSAEPRLRTGERWYVGRPVMVTRNDALHHLVNGDTGLVISTDSTSPGDRTVVFPGGEIGDGGEIAVRTFLPSQLDSTETWWSMTIHKSQGSEYRHAVVSLPRTGSPILTRELLYTAVTRAKERVTVVAEEAAIRGAIARPVSRATGLSTRLWP